MQRKMEPIERLAAYVEVQPTEEPVPVPDMPGYSEADVHYNIGLCAEAGYLDEIGARTPWVRRRFATIAGARPGAHHGDAAEDQANERLGYFGEAT